MHFTPKALEVKDVCSVCMRSMQPLASIQPPALPSKGALSNQ